MHTHTIVDERHLRLLVFDLTFPLAWRTCSFRSYKQAPSARQVLTNAYLCARCLTLIRFWDLPTVHLKKWSWVSLGFLWFFLSFFLFEKEIPQMLSAITSLLPSICVHVTKTRRLNQCIFAEKFPVYGVKHGNDKPTTKRCRVINLLHFNVLKKSKPPKLSAKIRSQDLTFLCPCIASIITNDDQQDALFFICLFLFCSTCFRRVFRPSSGALNCIYSFRYCPPILLVAGIMDEMELTEVISISSIILASWSLKSVPSHPRYQPPAISVDNTWSCKYSYVLLMMGETLAWNMYSRLEINK
jgi:hypothetical protein